MAKRRERTPPPAPSEPALFVSPRWRWPAEPLVRGRLDQMEEMDIASAPRPVKAAQREAAEEAARLERIDPESTADTTPMAISSVRTGSPVVREEMLRRLGGERPLTEEQRLWQLRLADLERRNPVYYHLLVLRFLDNRSDRQIAELLGLSHPTVGALIARAELDLLAEYQELFGSTP